MKLLSDHRRDLVSQRTRACCQLRWYLHELDPDLGVRGRGLRNAATIAVVVRALEPMTGMVARLARRTLERIAQLNDLIKELEQELTALVEPRRRHCCGFLGAACCQRPF